MQKMQKITIIDIQHKTFKKKLQGYDPSDVDKFLDDVIETLESFRAFRAQRVPSWSWDIAM